MNAAPPVSRAQPGSDAVQPQDPAASAAARAGSQDFAATLSDAGKPARKNGANRHQDAAASGSRLPAPGNQPPLAPPPAKTEVLAAAGPAAVDSAPLADAAASVSPTQTNPSAVTKILTPELLDPAAPPAAAPGADLTTPANGPTAPGSGRAIPPAASIRIPPPPGTCSAAAAPAGNARTAKLSDAAAKQGTEVSAHSAPFFTDANAQNDSTLSNGAAAGGTDTIAQAALAAAVARSTNSPSPDSSLSDDEAIRATGVTQDAAVLASAAAGDPATALARASAAASSAAMTAATAASAQVASAAANISAADRRSHGNSPGSTLPGASNDGSAGAAQLLTANTSSDSMPIPTFKIAVGVDTAQFGQGVADRVALMLDSNLTNAKLQVNPPALGPIEVRIALQGGHAQVSFSSHSAATRDALESSSAKLREMLGSQGFSSVSVDISRRSFQERSPQSQAYESAPSIGADAPVLAQASISISRSASGLLDAYA